MGTMKLTTCGSDPHQVLSVDELGVLNQPSNLKGSRQLTNTRTTLTLWPLQFLMWNMPFHAEHHLYPSIPFHALLVAHQPLKQYFAHRERGYVQVNRDIIARLGAAAI
jgi:fatty acid desaturase